MLQLQLHPNEHVRCLDTLDPSGLYGFRLALYGFTPYQTRTCLPD